MSKGGFFSESAIRFPNLQISKSPKKIFQKTILSLRFEKRIALTEEKPPLANRSYGW